MVIQYLVPFQHVAVPVADGARLHGRHVAAGVSLREAVAALAVAAGDGREVLGLQCLRPPVDDGLGGQPIDRQDQAGRPADPGQLFDHDRLGDVVGAGAAVLGGDAQRRQVETGAIFEVVPWELAVGVHLGGAPRQLVFGELAHDGAELVLLIGEEYRLHGPSLAQPGRKLGRPITWWSWAGTTRVMGDETTRPASSPDVDPAAPGEVALHMERDHLPDGRPVVYFSRTAR